MNLHHMVVVVGNFNVAYYLIPFEIEAKFYSNNGRGIETVGFLPLLFCFILPLKL